MSNYQDEIMRAMQARNTRMSEVAPNTMHGVGADMNEGDLVEQIMQEFLNDPNIVNPVQPMGHPRDQRNIPMERRLPQPPAPRASPMQPGHPNYDDSYDNVS